METLKDILWPVVVAAGSAGGLGRFIDFLIGKAGQERARDFLLKWWVRFVDVRWKNFGKEEGLFAGRLIERWFGKRIFSLRRMVFALSLLAVFLSVTFISIKTFSSSPFDWLFSADRFETCVGSWFSSIQPNPMNVWFIISTYLIYILLFLISISFTKYVTFKISYLCSVGKLRNMLLFVTMLVINYCIIATWQPITEAIRGVILIDIGYSYHAEKYYSMLDHVIFVLGYTKTLLLAEAIKVNPIHPESITYLFKCANHIDRFSLNILVLFPSLMRIMLSMVFVGSFLLRPLIMRPINLVWARIIESDKPVFTVIFGGAAAFATVIGEVAKHFSG